MIAKRFYKVKRCRGIRRIPLLACFIMIIIKNILVEQIAFYYN